MKIITKSRLDAIHNAGAEILNYDFESELSNKQIEEHHQIGQMLIDYADDVLRLMIKIKNNE